MPELPDLTLYAEALARRVVGQPLKRVRLASPFLLRTADPPIQAVNGKRVLGVRRFGKRLAIELEDELTLVLHLMIAGRLHWKEPGKPIPGKVGLAAFDFPNGTLVLVEASPKKRAALYLVRGAEALAALGRDGLEVFDASLAQFRARLVSENHTLKRALTDQDLFSAIGNAYSDEILHRARLSPVKLTRSLTEDETERLYTATRETLAEWTDRLREQMGEGFPEKVTAFRREMAVHGRYGKPCPVCGSSVQRIVYAENEANYCPTCQTEGRLLADRSLSRLLREDWPRSVEELERLRQRVGAGGR
ncbi:MAG TPA: DNA-formamidopyrimidine glycosylase family protein [Chloroflexota bacterium]|nr:DNA-formamidopyrimidine glycosylase family protein [Chloroflexota bacterium]